MIGAVLAKMLARRSYGATNRRDAAGFMSNWHEQATLTYPGSLSVSGTRQGKEAIEAWFRHFKAAVPTRALALLSISVQNIFDFVGTNVIAIEWEDRPVNKAGASFCVRGVTVAAARWGKITAFGRPPTSDPSPPPGIWGE
ncbi:MAG: nuclear transport factor 2 family protein [Candidatus Moduliflexus flocculans]|nr:nuclear transport factor 2 family protein [Candidatus Moduliflexus flocculans]